MRSVTIARKTAETDILLTLNLDGTGKADISTGCGFLDHMLTLFARLRPLRINSMVKSLISSFAAGVLSVLCVEIGFGHHVDKIIIGTYNAHAEPQQQKLLE